MYIGDGSNKGDINDFTVQPRENIVRLINWIFARKGGGNSISALGRVAAWFAAHQPNRPATPSNVRWENLSGLRTSMRLFGPNVSDADLNAAISSLPSVDATPEAWNTWDRSPAADYDYTDVRVPTEGSP